MNLTHRNPHKSWIQSICVLAVYCFVFAPPVLPDPKSISDETPIQMRTHQFFDAYAKEELDGFMALWSENSPNFDKRREWMQHIFAEHEEIQVKNLDVVKVKVNGDTAKVRVTVEMAAIDIQTREPCPNFGKMNRTLSMVKEGSSWKIWQYLPTEQDFIETLLSASTKEERARILSEDKELVTVALVTMLYNTGDGQAKQGMLTEARLLNDIAFEVAQFLDNKPQLAWCYVYRGLSFLYQSQYTSALENFQHALPLFHETDHRRGEAATLNNIGEVYRLTGKYQEALKAFETSLKIDMELGNRAGEAQTRTNIANIYLSRGKYKEALEVYQVSLKTAQKIGDWEGEATALNNIGLAYQSIGQYPQALAKYKASLGIAKKREDRRGEAMTLNNIGNVYLLTYKYAQALAQYEASLKIAQEIIDKTGEARALNNIGLVYQSTGEYNQAQEAYEESLKIDIDSGNQIGEAQTRGNIGSIYKLKGNYAEALEEFETVLKVFRQLGMKPEEAITLSNIGAVYEAMGKYIEALKTFDASLKMTKEIDDKAGEARALNNIGVVYQSMGEYAKALEAYEGSLKAFQELGMKAEELATLNNIGNIYLATGKYDEAMKMYEASLRWYKLSLMGVRLLAKKAEQAQILNSIGAVYQAKGQYEKALLHFEASRKIATEIGDKATEARVMNNIAKVYATTSQYTKALAIFETNLKAFEKLGMKAGEVAALNNMGGIYQAKSQYGKALAQFEASRKIATEIGDKVGEANALSNIGTIYSSTGQYEDALGMYELSLEIFQKLGMKAEQLATLNNIGYVYQAEGKYDKALSHFKAALKIAKEIGHRAGEGRALNNIGVVYEKRGDYEKALRKLEARLTIALDLGDKAGEARTLHNIGVVYRLKGQYPEALRMAEDALKITDAIGDRDIAFHCYWNIGNIHLVQKQWDTAVEAYQASLNLIEEVRVDTGDPFLKIGFFEGVFEELTSPVYGIITSLLALSKKEQAFQIAERAKARTLVELLENSRLQIAQAMTAEEKRTERELNTKIVFAHRELRALQSQAKADSDKLNQAQMKLTAARRDYDAFRRRLYLTHPDLQNQRGEFSPLTVEQATQWLQAQEADDLVVLEYVVGNDQIWVFALSGTGKLAVYPIPIARSKLMEHTNALQKAIAKKEASRLGALPEISAALQQLNPLLTPVVPLLKEAKQICIIPDDLLWNVPFAALKTPDDKFLIETHAVFYAPSVTALKAQVERGQKQQIPEKETLLAIAPFAPTDREGQIGSRKLLLQGEFGELSWSDDEVREISEFFDGTSPVLGKSATESHVKNEAEQVRILHFATHGVFDPSQGLNSGVLLASEPPESVEDGFLEAREIFNLDLNASLAVLSACETARGQMTRGEGIIGLSWALFVAGCPSTVVSQWKVADKSTAELMPAFYRDLKAGKNKVDALQKAQLSLLKSDSRWNHPFYWAPFILVGDWR